MKRQRDTKTPVSKKEYKDPRGICKRYQELSIKNAADLLKNKFLFEVSNTYSCLELRGDASAELFLKPKKLKSKVSLG